MHSYRVLILQRMTRHSSRTNDTIYLSILA